MKEATSRRAMEGDSCRQYTECRDSNLETEGGGGR